MGNNYSQKEDINSLPRENIDTDIITISDNEKNKLVIKNKNNIENVLLSLNEKIEDINTKLNILNEKKININEENNINIIENKDEKTKKNKDIYRGFPEHYDFITYEMQNEFLKKKKQKFKFEIKNDIKIKFITPLLDSIKKKDEEIKDLKIEIKNLNNQILANNNKLKDEISNEILLLKKQFENDKKNLENSIIKVNDEMENFKKKVEDDLDKKDSMIENLNKQLEESHTDFKNYKDQNIIEKEKLEKKIANDIEKKEKENSCKFEQLNTFNAKKNLELEEIRKEIKKLSLENEDLIEKNKLKDNEIKNLNEKFEIFNKNTRPNTIHILKEYTTKFNDILIKNCLLKNQELQHKNKLKYFSDKKYARVGLNNIGNNCYINSVIQILKNIPKFTYNFTKFNNNSEKFLTSLKYLLINMCNQNISSVSPLEFKTNLGIENKRFSGNDQYDSTIFYISLLNIIHKKLNKAKRENFKKLDPSKYKNKNLQERFEIWKDYYLSKNQSFIFDTFYIYYASEFECNSCHDKAERFQTTNFLDFPIISENDLINNLEECFDNYQMVKNLTDKCTKCYKPSLSQQYIILELPPVLIINLKRVGERGAYFNEINIPFSLDMSKIIKNNKINSIYELRGFIKHSGNENYGHNYAYCKNMFDDRWYEYNDSICSPLENEPKLDKIFFLCYIQIGKDEESINYLKQIIEILNKQK